MLDAPPGQLGDMDHAVHTADIHEGAVGSEGLDNALILHAHLDGLPDLGLSLLAGLVQQGLDRANDTVALRVDFGNAQLLSGLHQRIKGRLAGQTSLAGGDEHADALDQSHDAALILIHNDALHGLLALHSGLQNFPVLHGIQTLLGKHDPAFHIIHTDNKGFHFIAHMDIVSHHVSGIVGQLGGGNITRLLDAQINGNVSCVDRCNDAGHLFSCM